jgi:hypothetical protein
MHWFHFPVYAYMMRRGLRQSVFLFCTVLLVTTGCRQEQITTPAAELMSLVVQPATPSIAPGTTVQLQAFGVYSNNAQQNLTTFVVWNSNNTGVATVDARGLATAVGPGSTTILASFQNIIGSTVLTSSVPLSITLSPADAVIAGGTTAQYFALGSLQNGATQDLTSFVSWSSSDTGIAAISGSGLATAAASAAGSTTISASFGGITGTTSLTLAAVTSLTISPSSVTIPLGATQQFTASGGITGGFTQDLTAYAVWSSSTPSVATIGTGTASPGLAVSIGAGPASITASFGGVTSNTATLTVSPAVLNSISITPSNPSIAVGKTRQFSAIGSYLDGSTKDITASATWTSSNSQVATVSSAAGTKGLATALSTGTTSVRASFAGITSNAATLTVTAVELVSITVTPADASIGSGNVLQFQAVGTFSDNTTQDLTTTATWTSSNTSVAIISTVLGSKGFATAISAGTTTITAAVGNISGNTLLSVQ